MEIQLRTGCQVAETRPAFVQDQMFALLPDCLGYEARRTDSPSRRPLAEMNPGSGEITWSTIFPSEIANEILDLDVDD